MRWTLFIALFAAAALYAQQDQGVITGLVTDPSGAAVPSARVIVIDRDTNESRSAETSDTGTYTVGPLRVGTYDVHIEKQGFKTAVWAGIELHAADRVRADLKL